MTCIVTSTPITIAALKLRDWITKNSSQSKVAITLGVKQPTVSAWTRGTSRPEPHLRDALVELAGIPTAEWDTPEESAQRDEALARIREAEPHEPGDAA